MHVLITGSSGQIGTNVALALQQRGDRVTGVDIRPNTWTNSFDTVELDLENATADHLPKGPFDLVLHLAAHAKVFELVEQPTRALANVRMLFPALEYCRLNETPLIFASSREVYGDIHRHVTDESCADFVVAESPYSASKIAGEAFIYSYAECYHLPYLVFRFSNVYGRYDNDADRMERVIPLFIDRVARHRPVVVYGPEKVLDFTYIDDCTAGVLRAVDALVAGRVSNQTINLATGAGHTLVELVEMIAAELAVEANVTCQPTRAGEVTRYVADIGKAHDLLGYQPQCPLRDGLARAIAWQRQIGALD